MKSTLKNNRTEKTIISIKAVKKMVDEIGIQKTTLEVIKVLNDTKYAKTFLMLCDNINNYTCNTQGIIREKKYGRQISGINRYSAELITSKDGVKYYVSSRMTSKEFLKFIKTVCDLKY